MNTRFLTLAAVMASVTAMASVNNPNRTRLDDGWLTATGDPSVLLSTTSESPVWTPVSLPHDWSITFAPDSAANAGKEGGYLPGVAAVYRKVLTFPKDTVFDPGRVMLYLEGAYMDSKVLVNGDEVDSHYYGYTSWRADITDRLSPGDNVVDIVVDNSKQKNSRWYSGTGLYRPVWLERYTPYYIAPATMFVSTPGIRPDMAIGRLEATVADSHQDRKEVANLNCTLTITAPDGSILEPGKFVITMKPGHSTANVGVDFPIPDPQLWSPDTPVLYTATLTVDAGDGKVAEESVEFGLRAFDYSAEGGAILNGQPIALNGACVHHDNGMLGAAAYDAAEWRKAMLLKEAGFNAVRTSHNPPSPAFLDACDHIGLLVIDEAFDGWAWKKNPQDYGVVFMQEWPVDLAALITRDRNHPSVIAWSVGNEILERKTPEAVKISGEMAALCHQLDPTRPMTQALAAWDPDWEIYDPLAAQHDIVGYNYLIFKAESDHERVPERVMWQTESYPRDAWNNYRKVRDLSYVIGDFVWTGIDYLGESGIGRNYYEGETPGESWERPMWPVNAAGCGDISLTGKRKPISYYRDLLYNNLDTVYMAVREPNGYRGTVKETMWSVYPTYESWTWPGWEGKPIEVEVISRYPAVKLLLDGETVGEGATDESNGYKTHITIPYRPGRLEAVALDAEGKEHHRVALKTAGEPVKLHVTYESCSAPGTDDYYLVYATAWLVDADGVVNPEVVKTLEFVPGEGVTLLATGNDDLKDRVAAPSPLRDTYRGHATAVARVARTAKGYLDVKIIE